MFRRQGENVAYGKSELGGRGFAVAFHGPLDPGTCVRKILGIHGGPHRQSRVERQEPRLCNGGQLGRLFHVEEDVPGPLAIFLGKYAASASISSRIRLIVAPKLPLRLAAFPASTGIETLSIIRMRFALLLRGVCASVCVPATGLLIKSTKGDRKKQAVGEAAESVQRRSVLWAAGEKVRDGD